MPFGDTGIGASRAWGQFGFLRQNRLLRWVLTPFVLRMPSPPAPTSAVSSLVVSTFGEQQKASDSRYIGVSATYDNGPLSLGLGFDRIDGNTNNGTDFTIDQTSWQLGGGYSTVLLACWVSIKKANSKTTV